MVDDVSIILMYSRDWGNRVVDDISLVLMSPVTYRWHHIHSQGER